MMGSIYLVACHCCVYRTLILYVFYILGVLKAAWKRRVLRWRRRVLNISEERIESGIEFQIEPRVKDSVRQRNGFVKHVSDR